MSIMTLKERCIDANIRGYEYLQVRVADIETLLAQPEQEPLSDEEIAILWGDKYSGKTFMVKNFARAIEKAHGIGGEEWQPECCICKTNKNVEWVGGYQAYRCNSKDCIPL